MQPRCRSPPPPFDFLYPTFKNRMEEIYMKTIYLVWKNPACNGVNPEWKQLSGKEFFTLVRSLEGKNRYFVKLPNPDHETKDFQIVIEATKAAYQDWKKEKNHVDYLQKHSAGWQVISYHAIANPNGAGAVDDECPLEEMLIDADSAFENDLISSHLLEVALSVLTADERHLIEHLYLVDEPHTLRSYETLTGVSKSTASRRQKAAFEKLKKFFEK